MRFKTANPQIEDGHVDLANDIVEALARTRLSGQEMQCLWVIIRKTYGWHKKEDKIALSQFSLMTGMPRSLVCRVLKKLLHKRLIAVAQNDNSQINSYRFNKDFEKWQPLHKKITLLHKSDMTVTQIDNDCYTKGDIQKKLLQKKLLQKKEYSSNFLSFWNSYPKKVGKLNTFKQWKKLKPDLEILLKALNAQKQEKENLINENKFCPEWPDPERWIKNKRWEDEILEPMPTDETDRIIYEMKKERENNEYS